METPLKSLIDKLNDTCRSSLEAAAGLCLSRTNYNVEIEHWLLKLLEPANTDLSRILHQYDIDPSRVNRELTRTLDQLRTGNARAPELSLELMDLMRELNKERGATFIFSSHDPMVLSRAERVIHLVDGKIETAPPSPRQAGRGPG